MPSRRPHFGHAQAVEYGHLENKALDATANSQQLYSIILEEGSVESVVD